MFNVGVIAGGGTVVPVQYIGANVASVQSNGGTLTCALPAGVVGGDFLVAVLSVGTVTNYTLALTSAGWTKVADLHTLDDEGLHGANFGVFTKFSAAGETSVVAAGLSSTSYTILSVSAFRNVNTTTPMDVSMQTAVDPFIAIINTLAITPVTPGAMVVAGGMCTSFYTTGTFDSTIAPRSSSGWGSEVGVQYKSSNGTMTAHGTGHVAWTSGTVASIFFDSPYYSGNYQCSCKFTMVLRPAVK